ncbi:conserved hypothetical protein [Staphylococcus aureus]|nr:conserved hypothetical protein [Staphylococcus aureus]CRI19100.1 conserved hypothetical protein [Staphylococcus aureus]CRI19232.1 conserved hypothetical protein [Staphylococcus aureus]CRI24643.1 conserved hypothetical protein [Staphylococcus aureus]CRI26436.1 conserved hypothetical protein [Staphylococcus aureus]
MRIEKMARFVQGVRTLLTLIQAKVCVFGIGLKVKFVRCLFVLFYRT